MAQSNKSCNRSFFIDETKSVSFWIGDQTEGGRTINYIIRDLQSNSWGTPGSIDVLPLFDGEPILPFTGVAGNTDFIFKKLSGNKVFIAITQSNGGSNLDASLQVGYAFGEINGLNITFSEINVLYDSGIEDSALVRIRSLSALVITGSPDTILLSFISSIGGNSMKIIKVQEGEEDVYIDGLGGDSYRHFSKLIKKNNLVLAAYLRRVQDGPSNTQGYYPTIAAYNYDPVSKQLTPAADEVWQVKVPVLTPSAGNSMTTSIDVFFTGEDYNFMFVGPRLENLAVPA
jgi:hypothetical protein